MVRLARTLLVSLALLMAAWSSFTLLAASAVNRQVENDLGRLAQISEADRRIAAHSLQQVMRLEPGHPDSIMLAARLTSDPAHRLELLTGLVELRPRDGQIWAEIFTARLDLDVQDDGVGQSLRRATANGPWEPGVLATITREGLQHWLTLADSDRQLVVAAAARALQHRAAWQRRAVVQQLQSRGFMAMVCRSMEAEVPDVCLNQRD